jgi:hypothetical protein
LEQTSASPGIRDFVRPDRRCSELAHPQRTGGRLSLTRWSGLSERRQPAASSIAHADKFVRRRTEENAANYGGFETQIAEIAEMRIGAGVMSGFFLVACAALSSRGCRRA